MTKRELEERVEELEEALENAHDLIGEVLGLEEEELNPKRLKTASGSVR